MVHGERSPSAHAGSDSGRGCRSAAARLKETAAVNTSTARCRPTRATPRVVVWWRRAGHGRTWRRCRALPRSGAAGGVGVAQVVAVVVDLAGLLEPEWRAAARRRAGAGRLGQPKVPSAIRVGTGVYLITEAKSAGTAASGSWPAGAVTSAVTAAAAGPRPTGEARPAPARRTPRPGGSRLSAAWRRHGRAAARAPGPRARPRSGAARNDAAGAGAACPTGVPNARAGRPSTSGGWWTSGMPSVSAGQRAWPSDRRCRRKRGGASRHGVVLRVPHGYRVQARVALG